jgi:hypothetical protein
MVRFFSGLGGLGDFASAFRRITHLGRISLIKIVGLPNPGCSPCLRASVVGFLFFRSRAITAISRHFAAFCLRSPAGDPPPIAPFVENKDPTPIRPNGHRAVEVHFSRFSAVQSGPMSACFFRFYCSVGRGSQPPATNMLAAPASG